MVITYFIGGYVINTTLHDRLDIKIFSFRVEKYFTIERNTRREISYFRAVMQCLVLGVRTLLLLHVFVMFILVAFYSDC